MSDLCHCGTREEAIEVAKKLYIEMTGTNCPVWSLGVAAALRALAVDGMVKGAGVPLKSIQITCNEIGDLTRETIDIDEVGQAAAEHHQKLYHSH